MERCICESQSPATASACHGDIPATFPALVLYALLAQTTTLSSPSRNAAHQDCSQTPVAGLLLLPHNNDLAVYLPHRQLIHYSSCFAHLQQLRRNLGPTCTVNLNLLHITDTAVNLTKA